MPAPWLLVKTFLREATENPDFTLVADLATVRAKLRTIQRGHFTLASSTTENLVQIHSKIGETEFNFAIPSGLDTAAILEIAETALGLIHEMTTVAQVRALLARRRHGRPDFSTFRHD